MSDDVLVKVDNVSKRFCRSLKRSLWYGLQDLGSEIGGHRHGGGSGLLLNSADVQLRQDEFWAVNNVSFELRRGECLGLIGRNGSGKTTLLRIINGLIKPDVGHVETKGIVTSMIALGSGMNEMLTGRENIDILLALNSSSIKGKSRDSLVDEIIDFSELSEFIDAAVFTYSSGMKARLAFSVYISIIPDVLILDEVLSVGDLEFRMKCFDKMHSIKDSTAIIFVSHSKFDLLRMCSCAVPLSKGQMLSRPVALTDAYQLLEINQAADVYQNIKFDAIGKNVELIDAKIDTTDPSIAKLSIRFISKKRYESAQVRLIIFDTFENTSIEEVVGVHDIEENRVLNFYTDLNFSFYKKARYFLKILMTCSSYLDYLLNSQEISLGRMGIADISQGKLLSSSKTFLEVCK